MAILHICDCQNEIKENDKERSMVKKFSEIDFKGHKIDKLKLKK